MVSIQGRLQEYDLGQAFGVADPAEGIHSLRSPSRLLLQAGDERHDGRTEDRNRGGEDDRPAMMPWNMINNQPIWM